MPASSWPGGHAVPAAFVDWGFPVDDALPENVAYRQLPSPPRDDADWATRRFSFNNIEAGSVQPVVVALGPPLTGAPGRLLPRASSPRTWLTCPRRSKSGSRTSSRGAPTTPWIRQLPRACEHSGQCGWILSMCRCIRQYCSFFSFVYVNNCVYRAIYFIQISPLLSNRQ